MVYVATMSESQRVMCWQLILKEFGPNIQNIARVDYMVSDTLSRLLYEPNDQEYTRNIRDQCGVNELFETNV